MTIAVYMLTELARATSEECGVVNLNLSLAKTDATTFSRRPIGNQRNCIVRFVTQYYVD